MSQNKPNRYKVVYEVMEGDNYAGGWGEREKLVDSLDDVKRFNLVVDVIPVYYEEFPSLKKHFVKELSK